MTAAEIAEARRLVAFDWLTTKSWNRLHHAEFTDTQLVGMYEDRALWEDVKLACGQTATYVSIPGVFTRITAKRCRGCCRVLGYPPGKGSPKNDNACRALLGLDVKK